MPESRFAAPGVKARTRVPAGLITALGTGVRDEFDLEVATLLAELWERPEHYHLEYGTRVSIGARTFLNNDCLMLDVAPVSVASHVQCITATHPIAPEPRRIGWESAKPTVPGDDV